MDILLEEWVLMFNYVSDRAPQLSFCAAVLYLLWRLVKWFVELVYPCA